MIEVRVSFAARTGRIGASLFRDAATLTLKGEGKKEARISLVIVDDTHIARLNSRFLNHRGPTDVITFPLGDGGTLEAEVYISIDTARRQARDYGITLREECARLSIHAALHACGYGDLHEEERARMFERQEWYVDRWCSR